MDQRDKDLRAELGGIGVEVPPEFRAVIDKLASMGRGLGTIAARKVVGDDAPAEVRYFCLPFASEREALEFACEVIKRLGYAAFLDLAPLAVAQFSKHCLLVFLGVPCVRSAMVH